MDENQLKLKKLLEQLAAIRGRHTELVSVYIPAGFSLHKVVEQIRNEQGTASNIKSKQVRKNVMGSLEKILQHLKLYKETPANGLAVFCGNISEREDVDLEIWAVEPAEPIKTRLYWCGQDFILDPLKEMVREREVFGLIVVDKSDANIGLLHGKRIETLKNMDSIVPGKTKAGGWSQHRYERVRENLLNDFMKQVGEKASGYFKEQKDLKGVIIGGPGPIKEEFFKGAFLEYSIQQKVLGVVSTTYTGEPGLRELVDNSSELLAATAAMHEKKILDRFFEELAKDSGLAVYGFTQVVEDVKAGHLELVIISEAFDWREYTYSCTCGAGLKDYSRVGAREKQCPKCGKPLSVKGDREVLDDVRKLAGQMGTAVEIVSTDSPRGEQLKELGGIAGILRYKL